MITFVTGGFIGSRFQSQQSVAFQTCMPFFIFASAESSRSIMTEGAWVIRGRPGETLRLANNGLTVPASKLSGDRRGPRVKGMDVPDRPRWRLIN